MKTRQIFCGLKLIRSFCLLSVLFLLLPTMLTAQKPPEIQAIQDKMSRGEKPTPEEQKKMDDYLKSQSDKLDKLMEKLKNIKPKTVDLSKPVKLPDDDYLPKQNAAAHYNNAAAPSLSEYLALVKKYHDASSEQLTDIKPKLDETLAKLKTANELSNLGMMTSMSAKHKHDQSAAALYEVTAGAAKDAKDGVIAGNFGVLLKNAGEYEDSLKVLLYAEKLLPRYAVIQTNLGWTIAYLGDFFDAKTRFQKAVTLDAYDTKAYEGLGLLFRVEGNVPEAQKYLRMSLKKGFSIAAAKNLMLVDGKVDAVIAANPESVEADSTAGMRLSDVLEYPSKTAPTSSDGKLEFADTPDFFNVSLAAVDHAEVKDLFLRYDETKKAEFQSANNAFYQAQQQLAPIRSAPIRNGNTVAYPRSYEAEVFALTDMERIFSRRHLLRQTKMGKRFEGEIHLPIVDKYTAAERTFQSDYQQCARNEPCQDAAARKRCRAEVEIIKSFNGSFQILWAKYVQEDRADLKRFYEMETPWLREIADEKLRGFMNQRREFFIKAADAVEELGVWGTWARDVHNNWSDDCGQDPPPKNTGNSLRHTLKVFPDPSGECHVPTWSLGAGVGPFSASTTATCTKFELEFSAFDVYAGFDKKFGDKESDDITSYHLGISESVGLKAEIGKTDRGELNGAIKSGVYVSFRNGEMVDHGFDGSIEGEASLGNEGLITKGNEQKLANWKISGEEGPRSDGSSPINFTSVLDNLDN